MIRTYQNTLFTAQLPAKEIAEIGLRSGAALAQAACEAGDRFGTLHLDALRLAVNDCARASTQLLASEPSGDADATMEAMLQSVKYWRSLAGLVATTQAEVAEAMENSLGEMVELAESTSRKGSEMGPASVPVAMASAAGTAALASARALCIQLGRTARQFAANAGAEMGAAAGTAADFESRQARSRTARKAA